MLITTGGVLFTSGTDGAAAVRAHRVHQYERAGVDPATTDPAAPALGELAATLPDLYNRLILGEISGTELADLSHQLSDAAHVCARSATNHPRGAGRRARRQAAMVRRLIKRGREMLAAEHRDGPGGAA